jgi:hypothetical protein
MALYDGIDIEKGKIFVILSQLITRDLALDDFRENRGH